MGSERQCRHVHEDGTPCAAPPRFVMPSGFCWTHDPDKAGERRAAQRLGGARTKAKYQRKGVSADELGPLNTPQDAQRWAAVAAEAVATGRMSASQAQALRSLLAEWRAAHEAGEVRERLEELAAHVEGRRIGTRRRG